MKTTITITLVILVLFHLAEPNIKFKPFSISFDAPYLPFATLFLIISLSFFGIHYRNKGYAKAVEEVTLEAYQIGFNEGVDKVIEKVNKEAKDTLGVENFVTKKQK